MGCSKSKLPKSSAPEKDAVARAKDVKLDVTEDHGGAVVVTKDVAQPTPEQMAEQSNKGSKHGDEATGHSTAAPQLTAQAAAKSLFFEVMEVR